MTKKSTGFLIVIALATIVGLIAYFYPKSTSVVSEAPVSVEDAEPQNPVVQSAESNVEQEAAVQEDSSPVEVELMEEQPILGTSVRVREVREKLDESGHEAVRDLEFVIRPGILPARLFGHTDNVVLRYDQLHKNEVGVGAVTIRFYYEIVTTDTNGDGILSGQDKFDVAISYADGSGYTTLASYVDNVLVYEQSPGGLELHLTLQLDDEIVKRTYSLESNTLMSEGRVQF